MALKVICDGDEIGRTLPVDDASRPLVRVATQVNGTAVHDKFIELVGQSDKLRENKAKNS